MLSNLFSYIEIFVALSFTATIHSLFKKIQTVFTTFVFNIEKTKEEHKKKFEDSKKEIDDIKIAGADSFNTDQKLLQNSVSDLISKAENKYDLTEVRTQNRSKTYFFQRTSLSNAIIGIVLLYLVSNYLDTDNRYISATTIVIFTLYQVILSTIVFLFDLNKRTKGCAKKLKNKLKNKMLYFWLISISVLLAIAITYLARHYWGDLITNKDIFLSNAIVFTLAYHFVLYTVRAVYVIRSNKQDFDKTKEENDIKLQQINSKIGEMKQLKNKIELALKETKKEEAPVNA
jgi:hypothetical protein